MDKLIEKVKQQLALDHSGHGFDHVERVCRMAQMFAKELNAEEEIVVLAALLHDVDDYKLVGIQAAQKQENARRIMKECDISPEKQEIVLSIIAHMGYSKSLQGIRPDSLEGMIVSDCDMLDAIGVNGILRVHQYCLAHNQIFFDKDIWPQDKDYTQYTSTVSTSVCHFFEKLLKLKGLMLTQPGKQEAILRDQVMVDFLYQLFREEQVPEWTAYLDEYLKKRG